MRSHHFFIVLVLLANESRVFSFGTGPPDETHALVSVKNLTIKNTCLHMDPSVSNTHGKDGEQEGTSPFQLTVSEKVVNHGVTLFLTITKRQNSTFYPSSFKGFLVQGINQETNEIIGEFEVTENDAYSKKMQCYGQLGSAVSHKNPKLKSSVELRWKPPKLEKTTCVKFYATVLVEKKMFWVKKAINLVQVENSTNDKYATKSNFTCTDVDCNNDCFLNSGADKTPLNSVLIISIWVIMQLSSVMN